MATARSNSFGHLAEARLAEALEQLPGVDSAELSGDFEDEYCKIDILLRLKGDYEPLQLQVTGNPRKSPHGLPKDIIFFKFDLVQAFCEDGLDHLALEAMKKVIYWLKKYEPERLEGLMAYWGV